MTIKRICRWCGKVVGEKPGDDPDGHGTSTICPECFEKQTAGILTCC